MEYKKASSFSVQLSNSNGNQNVFPITRKQTSSLSLALFILCIINPGNYTVCSRHWTEQREGGTHLPYAEPVTVPAVASENLHFSLANYAVQPKP